MSIPMPFRVAMLGFAALGLVAVACGDDDDVSTGGSPPAGQATQPSGGDGAGSTIDPCAILTKEEVATALTEPGDAGKKSGPNVTGQWLCTYGAASEKSLGILQIEVIRTKDMTDALKKRGGAKQMFADSKGLFPAVEPVGGIGDEAYRQANSLQVLKGDIIVGVDLSIGGLGTEKKPTDTKVLIELANKVLQRVK